MIPTAIGLSSTRKGDAASDVMQDTLFKYGLVPYMPYLRLHGSYNLGMMTDMTARTLARTARTGNYGLSAEAIAESQRFGFQDFFHYGNYHYKTKPKTLRWLGKDGIWRDQTLMTEAQLAEHLAVGREFCVKEGINGAIVIDELPHPGPPSDPGKWGWTQDVENTGIKFMRAAQTAKWPVVFCAPPAAAVEYWHGKGLRPDIWVVTDPGPDTETAKPHSDKLARVLKLTQGVPVWLYNSENLTGLAGRIQDFNPGMTGKKGGYLHWSATRAKLPLFAADGAETPALALLVVELEKVGQPPVTPPPPLDLILVLQSQIRELKTEVAAHGQRLDRIERTLW